MHCRRVCKPEFWGRRSFGALPAVSVGTQPPPVASVISSTAPSRVKSEPRTVDPSLIDTFGRRHRYLRVSLTDRCNLRCQYCMPEEGDDLVNPAAGGELLTADELKRLTRLFVRLGVGKVRLTGGEPTIRKDFGRIVEDLGELSASLDEPLSLGITTNGVRLRKFLPQLRAAGLVNINLSLDTLVGAKFPLLTRRPANWHARVVDVLKEVAQDDQFRLKINCVLLKGANEDEIGDFMDLTAQYPVEVRFLEFMPFDGNSWSENRMIPQADIVRSLHEHAEKRGQSMQRLPPDSLHDVANLWKVPAWPGRIGIIASMTDAFCGGCNRLRLTADGQLRNCLFGESGWSMRDSLRAGADNEALTQVIRTGVQSKFAKLGGKNDMHELQERGAMGLNMMTLGG